MNMLSLRALRLFVPLLLILSATFGFTQNFSEVGWASWYGPNFAGRPTANGEVFDPSQLTAAHQYLPFGTLLRVTNLSNNLSVIVRINDRGPFLKQRIIDLSKYAAEQIDMIGPGTAEVRIEEIKPVESDVEVVAVNDNFEQVGVDGSLSGYGIVSANHRVGELLVLGSSISGQKILVRVVDNSNLLGELDFYVSPQLFASLGEKVSIISDR